MKKLCLAELSCVLATFFATCSSPPPTAAQVGNSPQSKTVSYEGSSIHYVEAGEGPRTVLLVHGWACDLRVWPRQIAGLAAKARVVAIDLPGHGGSEAPASEFSMDLFAKAVAVVLDDAGVEKAVLVGHSNGTPVIRQFYRLFPERTSALVAVDGALENMTPPGMADRFLKGLQEHNYRETVGGLIGAMSGPNLSETVRAGIAEMALEQPREAIVGGLLAATEETIWEADPIDVPLLLVLAQQPSWSDDYIERVKKLQPKADVRIWEDVSHFLMMERPDEFNKVVVEFLKANKIL